MPSRSLKRLAMPSRSLRRPAMLSGSSGLDMQAGGSSRLAMPSGGSSRLAMPSGGSSRPGVPFGGSSRPGMPFGGSSRPGMPFGGSSRPGMPFGGSSRPGMPFGGSSMPGMPFGGSSRPEMPSGSSRRTVTSSLSVQSGASRLSERPGSSRNLDRRREVYSGRSSNMPTYKITNGDLLKVTIACILMALLAASGLYLQDGSQGGSIIFVLSMVLVLSILSPLFLLLKKLEIIDFCCDFYIPTQPGAQHYAELGQINPEIVPDNAESRERTWQISPEPVPDYMESRERTRILPARSQSSGGTNVLPLHRLVRRGGVLTLQRHPPLESEGYTKIILTVRKCVFKERPSTGKRRLPVVSEENENEREVTVRRLHRASLCETSENKSIPPHKKQPEEEFTQVKKKIKME